MANHEHEWKRAHFRAGYGYCCACNEILEEEQVVVILNENADLLEALEEIVSYDGGADNALEDEYVMARVDEAIQKARGS